MVCNVDKLTYAANTNNLRGIEHMTNYRFERVDICNRTRMLEIFDGFKPDAVLHLAAESHVDRSIADTDVFVQTNVVGTVNLLNAALEHWRSQGSNSDFRFLHVSTDEVYGDLEDDGSLFHESTPYNPSSPYSASKAASDFMVSSWHRTYGLPVLITNCSNNYGPFQNIEKLIPHMITRALGQETLPVYGKGTNIRDWLHVDDHVAALDLILRKGRPGERYNVGGGNERNNLSVVERICEHLDQLKPMDGKSYRELITFVTDRPGHDLRYAVDASRLTSELGWAPRHNFETGLTQTVNWYLENQWWWHYERPSEPDQAG
ncbi:dTDP-glucose 4,6-dehydratase [Hoeflea sp. EC-HK425]|nr:dTDP-glucose 4,6-dehydratase [Hoeflea sp. EC-HK425]